MPRGRLSGEAFKRATFRELQEALRRLQEAPGGSKRLQEDACQGSHRATSSRNTTEASLRNLIEECHGSTPFEGLLSEGLTKALIEQASRQGGLVRPHQDHLGGLDTAFKRPLKAF